jgi:hypothetical protein
MHVLVLVLVWEPILYSHDDGDGDDRDDDGDLTRL